MSEIKKYIYGEFKQDPIYRAIKNAYLTIKRQNFERKDKRNLMPPSEATLHHIIQCLNNTQKKPEDLLQEILVALATQTDDYYYSYLRIKLFTVDPIVIKTDL